MDNQNGAFQEPPAEAAAETETGFLIPGQDSADNDGGTVPKTKIVAKLRVPAARPVAEDPAPPASRPALPVSDNLLYRTGRGMVGVGSAAQPVALTATAYAERRRRLGSKAFVAGQLGVSVSTLDRRESGRTAVTLEMMLALSAVQPFRSGMI